MLFTVGALEVNVKIKGGRATGDSDISIEVFKALVNNPVPWLQAFLDLFHDCLSQRALPDEWLLSMVVMILF